MSCFSSDNRPRETPISEHIYTLEPEELLIISGSKMPSRSMEGVQEKRVQKEASFQSVESCFRAERPAEGNERVDRIRKEAGLRAVQAGTMRKTVRSASESWFQKTGLWRPRC